MPYNKNAQECRRIFLEEIDIVKTKYENGLTIKDIAKEYKVDKVFAGEKLREYGIKPNSGYKYELDENYFDRIDSQNKAYIFGLFLADGCNHLYDADGKSHFHLSLSLQASDKELLERVNHELNNTRPLEKRTRPKKDSYVQGKLIKANQVKDSFQIHIYSKHMCEILAKHGMVQNKSLVLEFPNCIPNNLLSHFIRGYFDGNGSLYSFYDKQNEKQRVGIKIVSTNSFCFSVKRIIAEMLGINMSVCVCNPNNNTITSTVSSLSRKNVEQIMNWLYKDANLFMKRKHQKYKELFNINNSLLA